MREQKVKGVVLAAGYGNRLRPLTDKRPKPLIPFAGSTPLELALWKFKEAGINDVAINAHYLSEQIKTFVQKNPFKQNLYLSIEPEILGTGGVYNPLRLWQGEDDLLVYNGDIVSDIDFISLIATHRKTNAIATMAVLPTVKPGESAVFCKGENILAIGRGHFDDASARNFACAQVLSRRFIEVLPKNGSFDVISQGYHPLLARSETLAFQLHSGYWHDLGSPSRYWQALKELLEEPTLFSRLGLSVCRENENLKSRFVGQNAPKINPVRISGPVLYDDTCQIDATASIGPFVILEPGCYIPSNTKLEHCMVFRDAIISPNRDYSYAVISEHEQLDLR